jgi:hypothetical protein
VLSDFMLRNLALRGLTFATDSVTQASVERIQQAEQAGLGA